MGCVSSPSGRAAAVDPPATAGQPGTAGPRLMPLLRPLNDRELALHDIRNRLTYIAGTAHMLRRLAEKRTITPEVAEAKLERMEHAVWSIHASLETLDAPEPPGPRPPSE